MKKPNINEDIWIEGEIEDTFENIFNENFKKYLDEDIIPLMDRTKVMKLMNDINSLLCSKDPVILPKDAIFVFSYTLASAVALDKEIRIFKREKGK